MTPQYKLDAGFSDPVHDAQAAFREALTALSRPGRRVTFGRAKPGLLLGAAMANLLLTLTDDDTAVWWQENDPAAAQWLRFHTGATRATTSVTAAFAVVLNPACLPPLDTFSAGSAESPERSATLLVEVPALDSGPFVEWRGPGIRDVAIVRIAGLAADFWMQWQARHAAFPHGVDIVFTCVNAAIGMPRTTQVRRLEGV
jgi:alpha-D-ribose 1-methylphosphonate 5-triphosphate synthase subunit PhnH